MLKCGNRRCALKNFAILLLRLIAILSSIPFCFSHSTEYPGFKYSREANENFVRDEYRKVDQEIHDHIHEDDGHDVKEKSKVWLHSMGATLLISAAPFLVLFTIPLDNSDMMRPRLKVLLAFASGGLLGDAFLHLIPHAINPHHSHSHTHDHSKKSNDHNHKGTVIGLWVLGGIIAFLTVEKLVRLFRVQDITHGHNHLAAKKTRQEGKKNRSSESNETSKKIKKKEYNRQTVEIAGYLNLAADFAHNFTDGLAIGASFLTGSSIGVVTTITILLHEVPHEIGDFAILIKSGCSRRKAMLLQLLTAIGALSGNAIALTSVRANVDTVPWVLPFTAGGFIYIALVSVIPELLEESTKLAQSIKEICALLTGVSLMVFVSCFE